MTKTHRNDPFQVSDKPKVIVFREKHGDYYYLIRSFDEFRKVLYDVFKERYDQGYYGGTIDNILEQEKKHQDIIRANELLQENLEISDEKVFEREIDNAKKTIEFYKNQIDSLKDDKFYITAILANKDQSNHIIDYMYIRHDCQYESFKVSEFSNL